jgi:1-acyl-sn-glycerol-3-phosphate acyltransferase
MALEHLPQRARPGLRPLDPAYRPLVLRLVNLSLPLLLRVRLFRWLPAAIGRIEVINGDALARCWADFSAGRIRLILAFRHAEVDDPLLGLHLLARDLPRRAERLGLRLPRPLRVHFLFDRGMSLWGGRPLGWVLTRLGGLSVHRGRHPDRHALRLSRDLLRGGPAPFAMAPEGATTGLGERIGPLVSGVARLAVDCAGDLAAQGRPEQVVIVPVAVQYRYARADWARLGQLLTGLEQQLGLPVRPGEEAWSRLRRLGRTLLGELEAFLGLEAGAAATSDQRIERVRQTLLRQAECRLAITPRSGTAEARCRDLEEAAWRRIYRNDLHGGATLPPLRRRLADWSAHEAALAELRMRLVECFVAVSCDYVPQRPSFERHMELTLLLHDAVARLRGDRYPARPRLGVRHARVTVGAPLPVSRRLADARSADQPARGGSRELTASLLADIRRAFEQALI